jgi:hypothetical protein
MVVFTLITNRERDAQIALETGIQRIAIDLEQATKIERQAGYRTFISSHVTGDVTCMRSRFPSAQILVRVNSIHAGSREEFNEIAESAPQFIMLPFFTSLEEVDRFLDLLPKGSVPILLLESVRSLRLLGRLLEEYPIGEYFIGLNDLSLDLGNSSFITTLADPLFIEAAGRLQTSGLPWGFGGVGNPFNNTLPVSTRNFFEFQVALGASRALFSRNFRSLFDEPDPFSAVHPAVRELRRIAEATAVLGREARRRLCQKFLDDQMKNRRQIIYPTRPAQPRPDRPTGGP